MARITLYLHPIGQHAQVFEHAGSLIDWLQAEYPQGFGSPHRAILNGKALAVADYDVALGAEDAVIIEVFPAGPVAAAASAAFGFIKATWWASAIASAVIGTAASWAINRLFGAKPEKPSALRSTPSPSPVYSVGTPQASARLGDPIPVQYGRVIAVPDLASQPYTYYAYNEQYLCLILCLGQGDHQVHQVYLTDTPTDQISTSLVSWVQFWPEHHGQAMGAIRALTDIWENVDTSAEVADQELVATKTVYDRYYARVTIGADPVLSLASAAPASVEVGDTIWVGRPRDGAPSPLTVAAISADRRALTLVEPITWSGESYSRTVLVVEEVGAALRFETSYYQDALRNAVGEVMLVQQYGDNWLGTGRVKLAEYEATLVDADTDEVEIDTIVGTYSLFGDRVVLTRTETIDVHVAWDQPVSGAGPFTVCAPGREVVAIELDVVWPGGLYRVDDETGALLSDDTQLRFTFARIDDDGNPVAGVADVSYTETITAATNTPQRRSFKYTVTQGRYAVSAGRVDTASSRAQDQSQCYLTGLKGYVAEDTGTVYGNVTLLAMRVKASNGIPSDAASRVSVDCTRVLGGQQTTNPADAIEDLWTDTTYGAARPSTELDSDALALLETAAVGANGFNARFDQPVSVWEALRLIARPVDWFPVPLGSLISFAEDGAKSAVTLAFTTANVSNVTASYNFDAPNPPDGYEVEYRDNRTGKAVYTRYPSASVTPERVTLFGCTDQTTAEAAALGLWRRRQYRRRYVTFESELEGHLIAIGSLVSLDHPVTGAVELVVEDVQALDEHHTRVTAFVYDARVFA